MQAEYDFSNAKRAMTVPHLNRLREQHNKIVSNEVVSDDLLKAFKERFGENYVVVINDVLQRALDKG